MIFTRLEELPEVVLVEPRVFADERGWFLEAYKKSDFEGFGLPAAFVQDNHSRSTHRHVLRGLHYQKHPKAQGKLVRCTAGEIFDVAVDIRRGSPTYLRWVSQILSAANHRMLWIPVGFAHGVLTLTDVAEILYKTTDEYSPPDDRAIRWNDPEIRVNWPTREPVLSSKDAAAPLLADADNNFVFESAYAQR